MAVLEVSRFGGVAPSIEPDNLGPERAQTAENLDARYGDFRPVKGTGASVATVTASTKSLHRTASGTWLSSTNEVDYVNAQINDPSVERVYLTGRSAYPEAWQSGSYRRLGVRAPSAAPTVTHNVVDEFTDIEQQSAIQTVVHAIRDAVLANITPVLLGNGTPSSSSLSSVWLAHGAVTPMPTFNGGQIVYAIPLTAGAATNPEDQYLLDPLLHGAAITYSSASYWAVPAVWRPYGYTLNEAGVSTAIKALLTPPANVGQLVPDAIADQIADRIARIADATADPLKILVTAVNVAQNDILTANLRVLDDKSRVYAVANLLARLEAAVRAVDNYFANWQTQLGLILEDYRYLVPAAVVRTITTRFYRTTQVSDWGEESALSEPSAQLDLDQNDTVDITAAAAPATGVYGAITHWRLYRSSTTNKGAAWQFVVEQAIGDLTYTDSLSQEELEEELETETWIEPPAGLVNLCGGPNGIMLGSVGNTIYACEPDAPYAWPDEYRIPLGSQVVAIVSTGQSWIVLTDGQPYLISGADSASLSAVKLGEPQACVSKRGVARVTGGCLFPSPDGISLANTGGIELLTLGAYTKEDWAALTPSASFAAFSEGVYQLWLSTPGKRLAMDLVKTNITVSDFTGATGAYTDQPTDTLYVASGTTVLPMFAGSALTGNYISGIFNFDHEPGFAWGIVYGDFTTATLKIYANGTLLQTKTVAANTPFRVKAKRQRRWHVRLEGTDRATRIRLASSTAELMGG